MFGACLSIRNIPRRYGLRASPTAGVAEDSQSISYHHIPCLFIETIHSLQCYNLGRSTTVRCASVPITMDNVVTHGSPTANLADLSETFSTVRTIRSLSTWLLHQTHARHVAAVSRTQKPYRWSKGHGVATKCFGSKWASAIKSSRARGAETR